MPLIIKADSLNRILRSNQTPLYIYNLKVLNATITKLKKSFTDPDFQLLFATMANDDARFLSAIRKQGVGACVNSMRHLRLVINCGFTADKIHFTSTGISLEEMKKLQRLKVSVNLDSLQQIATWSKTPLGKNVGVRVNTSSLAANTINIDRLGIHKNEIAEAEKIAASNNAKINGLHIYVGTNYLNYESMIPAIGEFFSIARNLKQLEYVNIGGGIGIDYTNAAERKFEIEAYGKFVCNLVKNLRKQLKHRVKLIFEPGRGLAAPSGNFVTKIIDSKLLNGINYLVVDASIAVFPRPFHHPESPHMAFSPFVNGQYMKEVTIVGKTTFSKDVMAKAILSAQVDINDFILFDNAGAYCESMRSRFLGQKIPKKIFINE